MTQRFNQLLTRMTCAVALALVASGAAVAGAPAPPSAGTYTFSGTCSTGCTGTVNGTVDWTGAVAGSTFTLGVAGQALWLNHASVSEFSLYDYPTIPFGPVATPFLVRSTSGHYFGNNGSDGTWLYLVGFANPPLATGGGVLWSGISPVPEASSWLMLAAGLAMLRVTRWHSVRQGRRAVPA